VTVDLFNTPTTKSFDEDSFGSFITDSNAAFPQAESRVAEFRRERSGSNIVTAVAAMATT
jgi:hypothetical protein